MPTPPHHYVGFAVYGAVIVLLSECVAFGAYGRVQKRNGFVGELEHLSRVLDEGIPFARHLRTLIHVRRPRF